MSELSQLPVSERLQLVQDLWDSITETQDRLPVQEWHRELVRARLAKLDGREDEIGLTRDQVWQEVERRRGS